jgi:L,D-transpeptidase catalytic domain
MLLFAILLSVLPIKGKSRFSSGSIYKGSIRVYSKPIFTKHELGKIRGSGQFKILKQGKKCKGGRWYKIEPKSWVCSSWFVPSTKPPGKTQNWIDSFNVGIYYKGIGKYSFFAENLKLLGMGKFRKVRKLRGFLPTAKRFIGGFPYFRLFSKGYIAANKISPWPRTTLEGITVTSRDLPLAFITKSTGTTVWKKWGKSWKNAGFLPQYSIRKLAKSNGEYLKLKKGKNLYVKKEDCSIAFKPSLKKPVKVATDENWLDIDLNQNIIYAFRGKSLKKVILISASKETPVGIHKVYWKLTYQTFNRQQMKDAYYLEAVPWVMFFKEGYGIHGAYWHNNFGKIKTHGCINVSPADGKWLFKFLGPKLPLGYTSIRHDPKSAGGVIRLRR